MQSNLTVKIGADVDQLRKGLNDATSHLNSFNKNIGRIGGMIAGAFAVSSLVSFGKEVFNTTAKFQKFEAVLTNTLGSNGAAKAALNQITEFASKTPYQVDELTASFVKLANQGFIPTMNQMTSLGDLASAMGKSFDQLAEAIIDAQTGEFERLKEFGIRASKQGDKVTFTFKGVQTQVDFTSQSIRDYILSLGQIEGVTGGMAAQSQTLGGGLSNLEDSFEQLKKAIGEAANSGGLFSMALDAIAGGVNRITKALSTTPEDVKKMADGVRVLQEMRREAARVGDIDKWVELNNIIKAGTEEIRKYYDAHIKGEEQLDKKREEVEKKNQKRRGPAPNTMLSVDPSRFAPETGMTTSTQKGYDFLDATAGLAKATAAIKKNFADQQQAMLTHQMKLSEFGIYWTEYWAGMGVAAINAAPIINQAFIDLASGLGEALGNMASGVGGAEQISAVLLGTFGNMCVQLGQLAIATGIGVEGIKRALQSLNPYVAIAAGVALVALGKVVSNRAAKIAKGGSGGGGGGSVSGGGAPSRLETRDAGERIQLGGEVEINGEKLRIVLKNVDNKNKARRG
ncbi:MAG TPA: tape measure protein [Chryseosolibacter sp.]|nr:tape measure protein [Chryseosolibacter sp.]